MTRHYPDLGSASDLVKQIFNQSEALPMKFCTHFSDVISPRNQDRSQTSEQDETSLERRRRETLGGGGGIGAYPQKNFEI